MAVHPRPPRSVRLSLTDRCDLACVYCRPHRKDGYLEERLEDQAWKAMMEGLVRAGVRRVRLTGGEPLLHPRVVELVAHLAELALEDLALTTNGTRLASLALPLRQAGLRRITISLDSLIPERFFQLTRGGHLGRVLDGLDAALAAGFDEVKINTVILRGCNDDELEAITHWAWGRGITPRFIEVMRVGEGANLPHNVLVTAREMQECLAPLLVQGDAVPDPDRGPARYRRALHDPDRRVGFISGTSDTFCERCDRLRVASNGVLRPCLATNDGVDASLPARSGDIFAIERAVAEAWALKPDGRIWKGCTESTAAEVSMRAIGG
ncbi:MAG: GTP 3',8-cyclase MoaA [Myxococcales bacterium]|nr:GTP 3',8-cyclase MoaA [Polyangiaceae bacterium]MDW8248604.1 GTP 3',8-cyclase MoaA [Myxococcales bacterium]